MVASDGDKKEPLSSEELIRRAREGFTNPTPDAEDASPEPEPESVIDAQFEPEFETEFDEDFADDGDELTTDDGPPAYEDLSETRWEAPPPPPPPPPADRDAAPTFGDPPAPAPPDDPWASQPGSVPKPDWDDAPPAPTLPDGPWSPPPPPQRSGFLRLFSVGRWIMGGIILVAALGTCFGSGDSFEELMIGDCFQDPGTGEVSSVDTVDCNELHDFELYARVTLGPESRSWPGETALFGEIAEECFNRFGGYVGTEWDFSAYDFDAFIPVESAWDIGDREGLCVIYEFDENFNPVKAIGSARNSGR